ncbi:MAG: 4-hydroxy-tetrahydrodipicolinate synthase [Vicingaceae bacterium]
MSLNLKGTGVAIVTPFNPDKTIDIPGLRGLVEHIVANRVEYIVVMGTTGESVTLTSDEKQLVLKTVLQANKGRCPVILGIGGNDTSVVTEQIRLQNFTGIDGILSVSPYYNKPTQEGIYQHYKIIGETSPVPVILYNVPARTGSNVLPETVLRIAHDIPNIIAVKEASGDVVQSLTIIKDKPKNFFVLSGEDMITLPLMASGADGVISVAANAFPLEFSNMVRQAAEGNLPEARKNHYLLQEFIKYLFVEGNPGGVKAALKILGITGDEMRLPLVRVSNATYQKLDSLVNAIKKA